MDAKEYTKLKLRPFNPDEYNPVTEFYCSVVTGDRLCSDFANGKLWPSDHFALVSKQANKSSDHPRLRGNYMCEYHREMFEKNVLNPS